MRKRIQGILEKEGKLEQGRAGRGWWDEECEEGKRRVRRELRKWRKGEGEGKAYREEKVRYKELLEAKKKEENGRWEREMRQVKTEGQVWKVVGKDRKKRKRVNEGIRMEEWDDYFRGLLGRVDGRVVRGRRRGWNGEGEEGVSREEVKVVLKGLRDGKAAGMDGITSEVWKYGGEGVEEWVWRICDRIWKGEGLIGDLNEGVIVPIVKKGEGVRVVEVEEYRGVTLTSTLYKIYASILSNRLRKEVEERGLVPQNQTGFRRGMGTVDNIFTLNYLVNRQISRAGEKLVAFFVDLRAAFDSVDRGKLIEAMRDRGVREGLIDRCEDMVRETRNRVRVGEMVGESFWTGRGVRQGCPLSPHLFNLLMADLEEELRRGRWGGVRLGEDRTYSLAYADDLVLMAEEEGGMKCMMARLEGYLDRKGLELNVEKSKMMRFRKGGGREKKISWRWKGKVVEEVKQFTYLGYTVQRNGGQEAHIRERVRKGAAVMGQVWSIGKKRFGRDWGKRLWLFDALVWPVVGYGVEIWGWREREGIERLQERYLRWVMGVEWNTPGYMVREEWQRGKLREKAGRRAWGFEKRLEEGRGSSIARKCWEEMRRRTGRGDNLSKWEWERKSFFEERGMGVEEAERRMEEGGMDFEEVLRRDREMEKKERWEKIRESKFNKWYGWIKGEGIPIYLKRGWGESRWQRVARFRMGNEMRDNWYWREEEERKCRICGRERETWEHVWDECLRWGEGKGWQEMVEEVLGEEGRGEGWLRKLELVRGKREEEEEGAKGVGGRKREGENEYE